ncbi:Acetyltransferase (GNAT) family protein [Geodermatophilus siccatus]|uniref:Acetyltransferase (GNAT) family protein n=1 Tax=Geodermatophilus siccatus TaxID=1137991 RepID=A0A1G9NK28_9ACTN|nr:GNAT family N-acetyltransferase [Geodermatophilus siccatus]SDL86724.1 Acetyltransferase (GNAT) family protein [Geodermatophilus siccatus]
MTVERTVHLRFGDPARTAGTHRNLSAVRSDGAVLWVAGDETATIERLVADDPGEPRRYAQQAGVRLADLVELPGTRDDEADIEGLARDGCSLWAVGSHSLRRKQIEDRHGDRKALRRLAEVTGQPNRQILVRLPVAIVDGLPTVVPELEQDGVRHRAASFGVHGPDLRDVLADDEHLGPFLPLPGKDGGLDVEGIAVAGPRVYLGLRGPVLRGWAVVLQLRPEADPDAPERLRLSPLDDGRAYRKHVLRLGGLGVRDLCPDGDDLLVLAGPTMDLDGPVHVVRWHGALRADTPQVVRGDQLTRELDLPHGEGCDHAEGIGLLGPPGSGRLVVVHDSPSPARLTDDGVLADVVRLPGAPDRSATDRGGGPAEQEATPGREESGTTSRGVHLREITDDNREAVRALRVRGRQERFVASVSTSLRDAAESPKANPWYRAVYCGEEPVGFVMLSWKPRKGPYRGRHFLWRLLVDKRHQGRGIGRAVLTQLVDLVRADGGTELLTSIEPGKGGPWPFYQGLGFQPTGELDDGEIVLRLPLPAR